MGDSELPVLVLTAICDASARPAAVTRGHGDAMERVYVAAGDTPPEVIEVVELPIAPAAFAGLRKVLGYTDDRVTVYDLFPLSPKLDPQYRTVAGQFLAAEALWALEEQGGLGGVPLRVQLDAPKGWSKDPKALHEKLVEAHALDLTEAAVEAFKRIKTRWDEAASRA